MDSSVISRTSASVMLSTVRMCVSSVVTHSSVGVEHGEDVHILLSDPFCHSSVWLGFLAR